MNLMLLSKSIYAAIDFRLEIYQGPIQKALLNTTIRSIIVFNKVYRTDIVLFTFVIAANIYGWHKIVLTVLDHLMLVPNHIVRVVPFYVFPIQFQTLSRNNFKVRDRIVDGCFELI